MSRFDHDVVLIPGGPAGAAPADAGVAGRFEDIPRGMIDERYGFRRNRSHRGDRL
jgi:hypothetical protein